MLDVVGTSQFKKDVKRLKRQGKDFGAFKEILSLLSSGHNLPAKYQDHSLKGNWKGKRDCHIEPDWVLIYEIKPGYVKLWRTGSHSELFSS